jgi:hypothetical protein
MYMTENFTVIHDVLTHDLTGFEMDIGHERLLTVGPSNSPFINFVLLIRPPLLAVPSIDDKKFEIRVIAVR